MDVAAKQVLGSQPPGDGNDLLHGIIRTANDAGTEKQTFDVVAPVKIQRQLNNFFWSKPRARDIARDAVNAVKAIVDTIIREQNFEQRNTTPIRGVAVTNAGSSGRSNTARPGVSGDRPAAGTRRIVLGCVSENGEFTFQFHEALPGRTLAFSPNCSSERNQVNLR